MAGPRRRRGCPPRIVYCARSTRLRVADADRRFTLHEHERHRLADDVARADHHDVAAFHRDLFELQHAHHAVGRAGREMACCRRRGRRRCRDGGPSTSFAAAIELSTRGMSMCAGSGSWTRMPWMAGSSLSDWIWATSESVSMVAGSSLRNDWMPTSAQARTLLDT